MAERKNQIRNASSFFIEDVLFHFQEWMKRMWVIILVLAMIGTVGLSLFTRYTFTPSYSASATFTVNVDVKESSSQTYNKATASQLAATFPNILTSSSLNKVICNDLGVDSISAKINASVIEDTNLFTITVTDSDPQRAYDVLQSVITNYPSVARFVIGSTQLTLIDTSAISTMPTNMPNYTKKAFVGMLAGAFAGLAIIMLLSLTTSTVIRSEDIRIHFNQRCLGTIAELSLKKRSKEKEDVPSINNPNINYKFREGIFTLRNTVIRECRDNGYKSVFVTSTLSGEGKSTVAINLAQAIALKGYRTCLVDLDLRVPSVADYIGIDTDVNSVSDYINGNALFEKCVYSTEIDRFYVAVEKKNNANASELIDRAETKEFIQKLCEKFEFVIIDTPPTSYISDAAVIGDYTDCAVYVVAQDLASRRVISDNLSSFDDVNATVLGCVLNRVSKGTESIGYGRHRYSHYRYGRNYHHYGYTKPSTDGNDTNMDSTVMVNIDGVEFED